MLKKLQKKFVILIMLISIMVVLLTSVSINAINYISVFNNADDILELLIDIDFDFDIKPNYVPRNDFPNEIAFTTRFFVVKTNAENEIYSTNLNSINHIDEIQAEEYANIVNEVDNTAGVIGNFRYLVEESDVGNTYVFLDIQQNLQSANTFLGASVFIMLIMEVLIFLLAIICSKKAVAPIVDSYERQKRFITDATHDFKTPLAIIRADNDVIEIETGETEWTRSINTQTKRLNTLVENLITLTKLDEEKKVVAPCEFCLSDKVQEIVSEFATIAQKQNLELNCNIKKEILYTGVEDSIKKVFMLLLENALKYADKNTVIDINLYKKGSKIILNIQNKCSGVKAGKHNNWFDRFYRQNESRNSKTSGFGIGLCVAKTICEKHKAKIKAESKIDDEVIIEIVF